MRQFYPRCKRARAKKCCKDVYIVALPWLSRKEGERGGKKDSKALLVHVLCKVGQLSLHKQNSSIFCRFHPGWPKPELRHLAFRVETRQTFGKFGRKSHFLRRLTRQGDVLSRQTARKTGCEGKVNT